MFSIDVILCNKILSHTFKFLFFMLFFSKRSIFIETVLDFAVCKQLYAYKISLQREYKLVSVRGLYASLRIK